MSNVAKLALLGIPFDDYSSFLKGPALAPARIREALWTDASYSSTETGHDLAAPGLLLDAGDVQFSSTAAALAEIERAVAGVLDRGLRPICLGGDHSVTYAIIRAFAPKFPRLNILHFDAHPDLYDEFQSNRFSHACPFARIMEEKLAARLVQVGIRTLNPHQREQAARFGVEICNAGILPVDRIEKIGGPLYISFDMDVLDPAFAPGVSHHEPGGLSTREAIQLIHAVRARIVGADVVELNPTRDPLGITAAAAAKIVKELAGRMLSTEQ